MKNSSPVPSLPWRRFVFAALVSAALSFTAIPVHASPAGAVVAWGADDSGQATPPGDLTNVIAVAAGDYHCLALRADGSVAAWGNNNDEQVSPLPDVLTNHTATVTAIAADGASSVALLTDGSVLVWGDDGFEQTVVPPEATNVVAISAGGNHISVVRAGGSVFGWGSGAYGQNIIPAAATNVTAIAEGDDHILALRSDGTVIAWGADTFGQASPPTNLTGVISIAANGNHSLALKADGTVVAWGENTFGESTVPDGLTNIVAISAGQNFSLAIRADGTIVGWGDDSSEQLDPPGGLTNVSAVAGGTSHAVAISTAPLLILRSPRSQTVPLGETASFSVSAYGDGPIAYQWYKGGSVITDATNSSLLIVNAQHADEGTYTVVVSNPALSLTNSATLTIQGLTITVPPESQTVPAGTDVTFTVGIIGDEPIRYQWRKDGTDLPGATHSSLFLRNVQVDDEGTYSVFVSNAVDTATSSAELHVCTCGVTPLIAFFGTNGGSSNIVVTAQPGYNWGVTNFAPDWITVTSEMFQSGDGVVTYTVAPLGNETNRLGTLNVAGRTYIVAQGRKRSAKPVVKILAPIRDEIVGGAISNVTAGVNYRGPGPVVLLLQQETTEGILNFAPEIILDAPTSSSQFSSRVYYPETLPGTNKFTAYAYDMAGNRSVVATRIVFLSVTNFLTLRTNGLGTITPQLAGKPLLIGKGYLLNAVPKPGQIFSNWSRAIGGDSITNFTVVTNNPRLVFLMESNLILQANFVTNPFIATKGVYNGLFYNDAVTHDSSGFFTFTLATSGAFGGRMMLDGDNLSLSGKLDAGGETTIVVKRGRKSPVTVQLAVDVSGAKSDQVNGFVSSSNWVATLLGDRAVFGGTNHFTRTGTHTMILPGWDDALLPLGDGFGAVNIDRNGMIHFAGELSDGTAISQNVPISKNLQWPLYFVLYSGKGSIISWITLTDDPSNSLVGRLSWSKPGNVRMKYYPLGFTNQTDVIGSTYHAPTNRTAALSLTNGVVALLGGNLKTFADPGLAVANLTNEYMLTSNNVFIITNSTNRLTLKLNKPTGTVKGSFLNPGTRRSSTISGALLQQQNTARGYFLGTNESGHFQLQENP